MSVDESRLSIAVKQQSRAIKALFFKNQHATNLWFIAFSITALLLQGALGNGSAIKWKLE